MKKIGNILRYTQLIAYTFFFQLFFSQIVIADDREEIKNKIINLAIYKNLYQDKYWTKLLHYKNYGSEYISTIDDPKFFLSANGNNDPKLEMVELISRMIEDRGEGQNSVSCRFPARVEWLKEQLNFKAYLPTKAKCKSLDEIELYKPTSVTLVFPSPYNKIPSSMFGHTLLRINSSNTNELMSLSVNYAAITDSTNIFTYAYKGLFGYYKGYYSLMPYHNKIKEYNDLEKRNVWEYDLNLTEVETKKLMLHLIELQNVYSYYYFAGKNCAYKLLYLLEIARPEVELVSLFNSMEQIWVLPTDTIVAIRNAGLVKRVQVRLSLQNQIQEKYKYLNAEEIELFKGLIERRITLDLVENKAGGAINFEKVFDIYTDYINYLFAENRIGDSEYESIALKLKPNRNTFEKSKYVVRGEDYIPPDKWHGATRVAIGTGFDDGKVFGEIGIRPGFHDNYDPSFGFMDGSYLNIFDTKLRYYLKSNSIKLEKFSIIDIKSFSYRNPVLKPLSWQVYGGLNRELGSEDKTVIVPKIEIEIGFSYLNNTIGAFYGLVDVSMNFGEKFRGYFSPGIGVSAGAFKHIGGQYKIEAGVKYTNYPTEKGIGYAVVSLMQNLYLNKNASITLENCLEIMDKRTRNVNSISVRVYY